MFNEFSSSSSVFVSMNTSHKYSEEKELPDFDVIPSLICSNGMYSSKRWPKSVAEIIVFLEKVKRKYGETAIVSLIEPYDGFPGYIRITKDA